MEARLRALYEQIESKQLPIREFLLDGLRYVIGDDRIVRCYDIDGQLVGISECDECHRKDGNHNSRCPYRETVKIESFK